MKIKRFNENTVSSPFKSENMIFRLKTDYEKDKVIVSLLYQNNHYQQISVDIPDVEKLDMDEFFMDPDIDKKILQELIGQNFIEKTDNVSKAGTKTVYSYKLV